MVKSLSTLQDVADNTPNNTDVGMRGLDFEEVGQIAHRHATRASISGNTNVNAQFTVLFKTITANNTNITITNIKNGAFFFMVLVSTEENKNRSFTIANTPITWIGPTPTHSPGEADEIAWLTFFMNDDTLFAWQEITDDHSTAGNVSVDTTNFSNNLDDDDDTVQAALETLDALTASGGGNTDDINQLIDDLDDDFIDADGKQIIDVLNNEYKLHLSLIHISEPTRPY